MCNSCQSLEQSQSNLDEEIEQEARQYIGHFSGQLSKIVPHDTQILILESRKRNNHLASFMDEIWCLVGVQSNYETLGELLPNVHRVSMISRVGQSGRNGKITKEPR